MVILDHIRYFVAKSFLSQFMLFCVNFWGLKLRSRNFFDKCDVWTQALFPIHCWSWKLKFISFDFLKFHRCEVFTSESSTANNIQANLGRAFLLLFEHEVNEAIFLQILAVAAFSCSPSPGLDLLQLLCHWWRCSANCNALENSTI